MTPNTRLGDTVKKTRFLFGRYQIVFAAMARTKQTARQPGGRPPKHSKAVRLKEEAEILTPSPPLTRKSSHTHVESSTHGTKVETNSSKVHSPSKGKKFPASPGKNKSWSTQQRGEVVCCTERPFCQGKVSVKRLMLTYSTCVKPFWPLLPDRAPPHTVSQSPAIDLGGAWPESRAHARPSPGKPARPAIRTLAVGTLADNC